MYNKVSDTTAANALGIAPGRKLLRVPSGAHAGRSVALVQTASSTLKFAWSDSPRTAWSGLITVATDAADQPFDAVMDGDGNVHVVYTEIATGYLVARMLTFSGGSWSVGDKVTVYSGGQSLYPSLAVEPGGTLWVAWTRESGGNHYVAVKSSLNSGATWGGGASDSGDTLTEGMSSAFAKLVVGPTLLHALYTTGGSVLSHRSMPLDAGAWSAAFNVASGSGFDQHFDAGVAPDGLLAVVFDGGGLKYRDYDGQNWGAVVTLDTDGGVCPQLIFDNAAPVIVYLGSAGADQALLKYTARSGGSFPSAAVLDTRAKPFDKVILYSDAQASYADVTAAAGSSTTADIYHPSTNVMVKDAGDIIYFGMARPFRFLRFRLAVPGYGGAIIYSYWDGASWRAITPLDGSFALDQADEELRLWETYEAIPHDWQKRYVEGELQFWLRLHVSSPFTVGPVGSQITAISDLEALSVRR